MTTKLSKVACAEIARKMVISLDKEINECKQYFNDLHEKKLINGIPKHLLELYKDYFKVATRGYLYLNGNSRCIETKFNSIICKQSTSALYITDKKEVEEANKIYDLEQILRKKRNDLKKELTEVLFKLSTYKRITEHLPEAVPYLPEMTNLLPQINLNEFREKLKKELK